MKALVVGCGSIGRRHLRNLKSLGVGSLLACDLSAERRELARSESGAAPFASLDEALAQKPELAVIATPSSLHLEPALAAAKKGCHLFVEKPVAHRLEGLDALISEVETRGLKALVACNLRFHPGLAALKKALEAGEIGKVWTAGIAAGQYLPDWHPDEDYRRGYSARRELGGGVLLDFIHEIDYALWLFGAPLDVTCVAAKVSDLEMDVEDTADVLLRCRSGATVNVHMDYLQRHYLRRARVSGSKGTLEWDYAKPALRRYDAASKEWSEVSLGAFEPNAMYLAEMRHMLACVEGRETPAQDLRAGKLALEVALAAAASSREKRSVPVAAPR